MSFVAQKDQNFCLVPVLQVEVNIVLVNEYGQHAKLVSSKILNPDLLDMAMVCNIYKGNEAVCR